MGWIDMLDLTGIPFSGETGSVCVYIDASTVIGVIVYRLLKYMATENVQVFRYESVTELSALLKQIQLKPSCYIFYDNNNDPVRTTDPDLNILSMPIKSLADTVFSSDNIRKFVASPTATQNNTPCNNA